MLELVNENTLIKGEKYYVKRKPRYLQNGRTFECIFDHYFDDGDYAWVISNNMPIELDVTILDFYRYVSKEEYRAKLKEKYDATCLNIILRRLVNDDFRW
jgi:hypothetical protein